MKMGFCVINGSMKEKYRALVVGFLKMQNVIYYKFIRKLLYVCFESRNILWFVIWCIYGRVIPGCCGLKSFIICREFAMKIKIYLFLNSQKKVVRVCWSVAVNIWFNHNCKKRKYEIYCIWRPFWILMIRI